MKAGTPVAGIWDFKDRYGLIVVIALAAAAWWFHNRTPVYRPPRAQTPYYMRDAVYTSTTYPALSVLSNSSTLPSCSNRVRQFLTVDRHVMVLKLMPPSALFVYFLVFG